MSNLEILIDQTSFLLSKQEESLRDCTAIFKDLLSAVEAKLGNAQNEDEQETLEKVFELISSQIIKMTGDTQDDVAFLTEQLNVLNDIKIMPDKKKAEELFATVMEENEELEDSETFKQNINQESTLSKQNLLNVIADLKDAITESNAEEVKLFLESLQEDADADEEEDDEEGDEAEFGDSCGSEEEEGMEASGCGSCSGCSGGGCGSGSGCGSNDKVDLFELLNDKDTPVSSCGTKKPAPSEKKTGCC